MELYADKAPISVANFIAYVKSGHYEGTIFHRVIKRFMIQGGGFTRDLEQDETGEPIINESYNGLHNDRWTIAMARTDDPDSATAQFFINVKMNSKLDAGAGKAGYAVFGIVTDGFHVVKAIEKTATMSMDEFANLPVEAVLIERIDLQ
jgi:cyclophilin family peptidyl-prolyl cis-trans isomerase